MNISLNAGGFIGAFGGFLIMFVLGWLASSPETGGRAAVVGLVLGAIAGNYLWGVCYPKQTPPPDGTG
jgi:hypothetical protein